MLIASDVADLFDRSLMENLDHLMFLVFLLAIMYFGIRQIKKSKFAIGIAYMFWPIAYFSFATLYFLSKFFEGRSDQFVDWRDGWAFGLTEFVKSNNLSFTLTILFINGLVYLYARFLQWCGSRAEAAGKSKSGFVGLALIFPLIAWIILLIVSPGPNIGRDLPSKGSPASLKQHDNSGDGEVHSDLSSTVSKHPSKFTSNQKIAALAMACILFITFVFFGFKKYSEVALPMYGTKIVDGSFWCFTVEDFQYQEYQAKLFDSAGDVISTMTGLEVKESTGLYSDGYCDLSTTFSRVPLGNGPYLVEFYVNWTTEIDTREFESFDIEY